MYVLILPYNKKQDNSKRQNSSFDITEVSQPFI